MLFPADRDSHSAGLPANTEKAQWQFPGDDILFDMGFTGSHAHDSNDLITIKGCIDRTLPCRALFPKRDIIDYIPSEGFSSLRRIIRFLKLFGSMKNLV